MRKMRPQTVTLLSSEIFHILVIYNYTKLTERLFGLYSNN